jgi:hypothetical protein
MHSLILLDMGSALLFYKKAPANYHQRGLFISAIHQQLMAVFSVLRLQKWQVAGCRWATKPTFFTF